MKKIRSIIVDDEKLAREGVSILLSKDSDFELLDTCSNGKQAIESIVHFQPDLVFLDIQMPDINGLEVLKSLPVGVNPLVVFVTAFNKYAIEAFEAHAFDYLLKPFDDDRFYEVLKRCKRQIELINSESYARNLDELIKHIASESTESNKEENIKKIVVKDSGGVSFIDVESIIALEASDYYLKIITEKEEYLKRMSLNSLEEKLDPNHFVRIHRSTIVNVNHIKSIEKYTAEEHLLLLNNGLKYRISKSGRKRLKNRFFS